MACAGLLVCLLLPPLAEASFGKRSQPSESKSDAHGSSADEDTHDATAIGTEDDDDDDSDGGGGAPPNSSDGCCSEPDPLTNLAGDAVGSILGWMIQGLIYAVATTGTHLSVAPDARPAPGLSDARRHAVPLSFRMGAQRLLFLDDDMRGTDLFVALEGRRFGVEGHVLWMAQSTPAGEAARDELMLVEAHVTYAFLVREQLRLRAEAGMSTAHAPDATFVGPSLGLSFEACVLGPLDVEARAQVTPLPYLQLDGTVGLALHLGSLMVRGGWRGLYLDDLGALGDVDHQDRQHGPYLGAGFTF